MNKENEILNRLQELLPDYCFGRLSADDIEFFDTHKTAYPEIINEVNEVNAVFSRIERMDIDKILDEQTRNITVKVNNRLDKNKSAFRWVRIAVPAGMLAIIALYFSTTFNNDKIITVDKHFNKQISAPMISANVKDTLINMMSDQDAAALANSLRVNETELPMDSSSQELIDETISSDLSVLHEQNPELFWGNSYNSNEIYNEVDQLPEDEFNKLIEVIENVQIES